MGEGRGRDRRGTGGGEEGWGIPIFESSTTWSWLMFTKFCQLNIVKPTFINSYPLEHMEIKPVNPQGNQPWTFIERTDSEAEAPILQPRDAKSWVTGRDADAGKDWGQEEKWVTEDEMVGWHHWLRGHEFEQAPGKWRTGMPGTLQFMGSQRIIQK